MSRLRHALPLVPSRRRRRLRFGTLLAAAALFAGLVIPVSAASTATVSQVR